MKIALLLFALVSCGGNIQLDNESAFYSSLLSSDENEMLRLVNEHRLSIGKPTLSVHSEASRQAQLHSEYMAHQRGGLTHNGFSSRINEIERVEPRVVQKSAENVAYNSTTQRAHQGLLSSSGHRRNIEGDYTHIGIGEETDERGRMYFTQIFLKLK